MLYEDLGGFRGVPGISEASQKASKAFQGRFKEFHGRFFGFLWGFKGFQERSRGFHGVPGHSEDAPGSFRVLQGCSMRHQRIPETFRRVSRGFKDVSGMFHIRKTPVSI